MNLPRQPQVVTVVVSCNHEGDCTEAKDLLIKFLENRFDYVNSCWHIHCHPRAVND